MKNLLLLLLAIPNLLSSLHAQTFHPDSLDRLIQRAMADFDLPGMAVGIVQNDSILFLKGYGTREVNKNLPVDENTLFGIGSISKSFTALTLGMLESEGKIGWDDPVTDHLPYFELYDPYVTEHFTIRDLLTHRSGLRDVSGGALWYHSDLSRTEVVRRLKYLEPVSGFREKPAYQNVMYVAASEVVPAVTGQSWDEFVTARVFNRLSMSRTTSVSVVRESSKNLAIPHVWNERYEKAAVGQEAGDNLAPAGFIYSSAKDMTSYMRFLLNDGVWDGDTLIAAEAFAEIFKPQTLYPIMGPPFHNEFTSYGFGWWLTPKGSHKVIEHSGGIDGMSAYLFMIEDLNFGAVVLCNDEEEPATFLIAFKLLGWMLEDPSYDLYDLAKQYRQMGIDAQKEDLAGVEASRVQGTSPTLELAKYVGAYSDKMYGDISVEGTGSGQLEISFSHTPIFRGKLNHWHYDTFRIDWHDLRLPDGFATFEFDAQHQITGIRLDQPRLLDVDFEELEIAKRKE
ncbi:MAG: serine hydrolase [Saprospiraceae bacterium]